MAKKRKARTKQKSTVHSKQKHKQQSKAQNNPGISFTANGGVLDDTVNLSQETIDSIWNILSLKVIPNNGLKYDAISMFLRNYTDHGTTGSYRGVNFWSVKAWEKYEKLWEKHKPNLDKFTRLLGKHFVHEHILPVAAAARLFSDDKPFNKSFVTLILRNYVVAAVITTEENSRLNKKYSRTMPDSFYKTGNVFDRYIPFGINLVHVKWNEGNKGPKGKVRPVDLSRDIFLNELDFAMDDFIDTAEENILSMVDNMFDFFKNMSTK